MMTRIDLETYRRRGLFEAFKDRDVPCFSTCCNVEIAGLKKFIDANRCGFFVTVSYVISRAVNSVPELRHRIIDGALFECDRTDPGYTVLLEDETFSFCDSKYFEDFGVYREYAEGRIGDVKNRPDRSVGDKHHTFFITNVPWFSFTSFVHPYFKTYGSIPVVTIGKYFEDGGKLLLPVAVQVNHALVDGIHVGKFYQHLSELCCDPETWLSVKKR